MPVHQDGPRTRTLGLANAALLFIWAIMLGGNRLHALFNLTALRCKKLFTPCLRRIESLTGFISNTAKGTIAF